MKNLTKIFVICAIGLIVSGGLFLFFINPALTGVEDLKNQVSQKKSELNTLEQQILIYKNSKIDLDKAVNKDMIASSLAVREDLEVAIEEIELAAALTTSAESLKINEAEVSGKNNAAVITGKLNLEEIPYVLSTEGNFVQLVNFLQYLEHLPHFTEITKISLNSTGTRPGPDSLFIHSGDIIGTFEGVFFAKTKSN